MQYIEEPENIPLGGDRGRNTSNHSCDIEMGVAPKDSRTFPRSPVDRSKYTSLDFGLQVLDPVPQSRLTESDTMYNIGEMYIHASGALFTSNEVYGMESDDMPEKLALSSSPADDAGNECVICLTEVQQIFLLPCRYSVYALCVYQYILTQKQNINIGTCAFVRIAFCILINALFVAPHLKILCPFKMNILYHGEPQSSF